MIYGSVAQTSAHAQPLLAQAFVSSGPPADPEDDDREVRHARPAFEITGPLTVNLRAVHREDDRNTIFTITVRCTDPSGNSSDKSTSVVVRRERDGESDGHRHDNDRNEDGKKKKKEQ